MKLKTRRLLSVVFALGVVAVWLLVNPASYEQIFMPVENTGVETAEDSGRLATEVLEELEVKGRAPKTGYSREQFYDGWPIVDDCSLRQKIL